MPGDGLGGIAESDKGEFWVLSFEFNGPAALDTIAFAA